MYTNLGNKIKVLAKILCWVGTAASVSGGIVLMFTSKCYIFPGVLVIILGSLFSCIASFVLYGYSEIVENSETRTEIALIEAMKPDPKESKE